MIIVEYRVPMPFSPDEYRIGQLYTIAKKSRIESEGCRNGVKINANQPYSDGPGGSGQYTNKTYYLTRHTPDWLQHLLPGSAAQLVEEAWNAYPTSVSRFSSPLVDKLTFEIESRYLEGPPTRANVFGLDDKQLRHRTIVMLDIANDRYKSKQRQRTGLTHQHVLAFDPLFRAPLGHDWLEEYESACCTNNNNHLEASPDQSESRCNQSIYAKQLMTCYKLCRASFPIWPLQSRVEQFLQLYSRDTILEAHRQAWLWQDEWTGMSLDEIRRLEADTQAQLGELMRPR